jgi:hypothetical protein
MTETYPRDMIGYGRNPPDPKWPDEARVAVQFVVNYEEGLPVSHKVGPSMLRERFWNLKLEVRGQLPGGRWLQDLAQDSAIPITRD